MINYITTSTQQMFNHPMARPLTAVACIGAAIIALKLLEVALTSTTGLATLAITTLVVAQIMKTLKTQQQLSIKQKLKESVEALLNKENTEGMELERSKSKKMRDLVFWIPESSPKVIEGYPFGIGIQASSDGTLVYKRVFLVGYPDKAIQDSYNYLLDKWKGYSEFTTYEFNLLWEVTPDRTFKQPKT